LNTNEAPRDRLLKHDERQHCEASQQNTTLRTRRVNDSKQSADHGRLRTQPRADQAEAGTKKNETRTMRSSGSCWLSSFRILISSRLCDNRADQDKCSQAKHAVHRAKVTACETGTGEFRREEERQRSAATAPVNQQRAPVQQLSCQKGNGPGQRSPSC
jgi:hypothetical protein